MVLEPVATPANRSYPARRQELLAGSYGIVDPDPQRPIAKALLEIVLPEVFGFQHVAIRIDCAGIGEANDLVGHLGLQKERGGTRLRPTNSPTVSGSNSTLALRPVLAAHMHILLAGCAMLAA